MRTYPQPLAMTTDFRKAFLISPLEVDDGMLHSQLLHNQSSDGLGDGHEHQSIHIASQKIFRIAKNILKIAGIDLLSGSPWGEWLL